MSAECPLSTPFWYGPQPAAWANPVAVSAKMPRLPNRKNVRA